MLIDIMESSNRLQPVRQSAIEAYVRRSYQLVERLLTEGFDGYLSKPVRMEKLKEMMHNVCM